MAGIVDPELPAAPAGDRSLPTTADGGSGWPIAFSQDSSLIRDWAMPTMVLRADLSFVEANEALASYLGCDLDELLCGTIVTFVHEVDRAHVEALATDPPEFGEQREVSYVRTDGTILQAFTYLSRMPAEAEPARWFGQMIDLTDDRARAAKLERLNRLSTVLAETNEAVFRATTKEEILRASTRIAVEQGGFQFSWLGLVDDEGHTLVPVSWAGDGEDYLRDLHITTLETERGIGPSGRAVRSRASVFCNDIANDPRMAPWAAGALAQGFRSSAACPLVVDGRVAGVLAVYSNETGYFDDDEIALIERLAANLAYGWEMTERKVAAARMRAEREQAHRLESLGEMAGGIAHDFSNLIAVMLNYLALIERQVADAGVIEDLGQIRAAADSASDLIRRLLTFAGGGAVEEAGSVEINTVVRDLASLLDRVFGAVVRIRLDLGPEPLVARIRQNQLEQILMNLAVNARDAMPDGGTLTISTRSGASFLAAPGDRVHGDLVIQVADTGSGMSPEVTARAFEPFFTTKSRGDGTGLGLATVYGLVQQHGGDIHIDSSVGAGTTMTISLPGGAPDEGAVVAERSPASPDRPDARSRVLVVEDKLQLRTATARVLEGHGFEVLVASDGVEALAVLDARGPVDLVLTDLSMPRMRGDELARRLAAHTPAPKVLFTSGFDSGVPTVDRPILSKPVSEGVLLDAIRTALAR